MIHPNVSSRVRGHNPSEAQSGIGVRRVNSQTLRLGVVSAGTSRGEEEAGLTLQTFRPFTDYLTPARSAHQRKAWQGLQERDEGGKRGQDIVALLSQKRG